MMKDFARKTFQRSPKTEYKKVFRFYPYFLYCLQDKWLKSMSLKGWHIVHCGICSYLFEKGVPLEKEYFSYAEFAKEGYYSIILRHPFLEKTYGVKAKKSALNSNRHKRISVVEIDIQKLEGQNALGYRELVNDRNRLSLRYFLRNLSLLLFCIVSLVVLISKATRIRN